MSYFRQTSNYQMSVSESTVSVQSYGGGSVVDITNSQINYTPHPLAKKVIYEGSFYIRQTSGYYVWLGIGLLHYTNGSWSEISSANRRNIYTAQWQSLSDEYTPYFKYALDPWQGERPVKLVASSYSTNWRATFHKTSRWEGGGTDTSIMPQFMMYSVL